MQLTEDDIAYLRQAASRDNYNPEDALKIFKYESSGRPDIWGGKGNQYFGIFQAGPEERKQFGVDTVNPSAKNQIDAFGKFLSARGFKPGMGLLDMYSTVNAGSPGHYKASDGNGTVASHVAAMQGNAVGDPMNVTPAVNPTPDKPKNPIDELIAAGYDPQKMRSQAAMNEIGNYGDGLLKQAYQPAQLLDPAPMAPMQPMNAPIPQANRFNRGRTRGLLG